MQENSRKINYREIGIFAAIIVLQVFVILYWGNRRTNYFVDDLYSFNCASSFSDQGEPVQWITLGPKFQYNEWISNTEFKNYLLISEQEKVFHAPLGKFIGKMLTGRNYFGFLNIALSIAGGQEVSATPAILLNIIFFILADVFYISLLRKLKLAQKMQYLALAMFGFSSYVISAAIYVRFYVLVFMLLMLMLNFLYCSWKATEWKGVVLHALLASGTAYFSFKNSELAIPFFGAFVGCLVVMAFVTKRWKQFMSFSAICGMGVLYLLFFTPYIQYFLHWSEYATEETVAITAARYISNATPGSIKQYFAYAITLFETMYFAYPFLVRFLLAFATICWLYLNRSNDCKAISPLVNGIKRIGHIRPCTALALCFWLVLFGLSYKLEQGIVISLLMVLLILYRAVSEMLGRHFYPDGLQIASDPAFVLIMLGTTFIYTVFVAACGYIDEWRYYCFGFLSLTIILWYFIDGLIRNIKSEAITKLSVKMLFVFVVINSLLPFHTRNVDFVYEDEKAFVDQIKEKDSLDVIVFTREEVPGNRRFINNHALYDCVNLMSSKANLCFTDIEHYRYGLVEYPEELMIWCRPRDREQISSVLDDFKRNKYAVEEIGEDHCSLVYVCRRA